MKHAIPLHSAAVRLALCGVLLAGIGAPILAQGGQVCGVPPTCIAPTPVGIQTAFVGVTYSHTIRAQANNIAVGANGVSITGVTIEFAPFVGGSCGMFSAIAPLPGMMFDPFPQTATSMVDHDFSWTPSQGDIGCYRFTYDIIDTDCQDTNQCVVELQVTECMMIVGMEALNQPVFGDPNDILMVDPYITKPILLSSIPDIYIPSNPNMNGVTFYAQTIMINPEWDPADPVKFSPRLEVTIGNGNIITGTGSGMGIWSADPVSYPGDYFHLQFSIAGL